MGVAFAQPTGDRLGKRISAAAKNGVAVKRTTYNGWKNSIIISNGTVEAVIVPSIGRIMQFRFVGEDGPFWENRALDSRMPDPKAKEWINFGGDKAWPAPQGDWPHITNRGWPPPPAFDSLPVKASVSKNEVELISPVDPFYGIRVRRLIKLDPKDSVMTITTTYEKVKGSPKKVGIWVVTQLKDPVSIHLPVSQSSLFSDGYAIQSEKLPLNFSIERGLISLCRDPNSNHKIGSDAGTLLWVGEKQALRIDSPRVPYVEYPHNGSSAEVYTNEDPLSYVELEMHGPLQTMRVGDKQRRTNSYTLMRRTENDSLAEARKLLTPSTRLGSSIRSEIN